MPLPPTDPRAFSYGDLPLPPTMNDAGTLPNAGMGAEPRADSAGLAENSGRRLPGQKAFDHYNSAPATSPYLLLNNNTGNGTISTYTAYVRPAEDQQRANQEFDRAATNAEGVVEGTGPSYPPMFLNYHSYYPNAQ